MNKLIAALKRSPRRFAGLAVVLAAVIIPASLLAWGPDRPTYTMEHPADHVTFNSITNNPKHGDERNFVQIREAGGTFGENVQIQPGKTYDVYVFYHNNYRDHTESEQERLNGKGVARDTTMRVQMPASVKAGEKARFTGVISASNAQPSQVWDEAYGTATSDVALRYVPNSAKITNNGATNGSAMPNSLFTTGAYLGFNNMDGNLPGCNEFSGYVIYQFTAVQPNFEIQKQVSKAGQNQYAKRIEVKKNDIVDYKIQYKNTGSVQQDKVVIKDELPAGVEYVNNSTFVATSQTGGKWTKITDNGIIGRGINIGSYAPGGNAYVKFSAKITDKASGELVNTAYAETDNGTKKDTAVVTVKENDKPQPPVASYQCSALVASKIDTDNTYRFDIGYSAKNANFQSVTYVVKDEAGKVIAEIKGAPKDATYKFAQSGKFTVEAVLTFNVNGEAKTTTDNCKQTIEIPAPKPNKVEVCDLTTKKIVTVDQTEVSSKKDKYSTNLEDCKKVVKTVEVCDLTTKKIVTVDQTEVSSKKDKYSTNLEDCKKVVKTVEVCDLTTKKIVAVDENEAKNNTAKYSEDMAKCNETPATPEVPTAPSPTEGLPVSLPTTGPETAALSIAGLGIVTLIIGYAITGRRA